MNKYKREDFRNETVIEKLADYAERKNETGEMKSLMFGDWLAGDSYKDIGKKFNKSSERVREIIDFMCRFYLIIEEMENKIKLDPTEETSIRNLLIIKDGLQPRQVNILYKNGITNLRQLSKYTEEQFWEFKGNGKIVSEPILRLMDRYHIRFKENG